MIRRQTAIALGIAVVLGLLAVYLANVFLTTSQQQAAQSPEGTTKVAVAAIPLDYGVELSPDKIRFVDYPSTSLPPGSFNTLDQLLPAGERRVALRPMLVNEPILATKVSGAGQSASLAAILPEGKRAMAVRVNDVSGVAGFIQPNDSVDVLVTRASSGERGEQITDVLLQNIRVLALDQNAKDANGQPVLARTATLEVDTLEAQKLALAQQVGTLSLVLRKPGEQDNNPVVETVSLNDLRYSLYGGARYAASAPTTARPRVTVNRAPRRATRPAAPVVTRPSTSNVQVVRGTENSDYEVGEYGS